MLKILKLTNTIDKYLDFGEIVDNPQFADILLVGGKYFNIKDYPNLKAIFKTGVGTDNLPFDLAKDRNIIINLPSESTKNIIFEETANFTCNLIFKSQYQSLGNFDTWEKNSRISLSKKNLLILGIGKIGTLVQKKMSSFMNILTYDPIFNKYEELLEYIKIADCITLHMPLNTNTISFVNNEFLSLMKKDSALINTSRGSIVNETDLFNILYNNHIQAYFDVFWEEPYVGKLSNFTNINFHVTPHVASTCEDFIIGIKNDFQNFYNFLNIKK